MSKELKSCPFCGGEARLYGSSKPIGTKIKNYQAVYCLNEDCSCRTGFCEAVADAIERWNKRKPIKKIVEELEEQLGNTNFEKATKEVNESYYDGMGYAYDNAIEIVKRGGVNDD